MARARPLPEVAGAAGATPGFVRRIGCAPASAAVAHFDNARDPLAMTATMAACTVVASAIYAFWARPAEITGPALAAQR